MVELLHIKNYDRLRSYMCVYVVKGSVGVCVCDHVSLYRITLIKLKVDCYFISGTFVKEKDRCKKCKGKQVCEEDCTLDVSGRGN